LIGVTEAKSSCGLILGFSAVGKLFTLPNIDGDLTSLSAMFLILMAIILGMIFDSELLQGDIQDFGKTFSVQVIAANPSSYYLW
jgi:hypothetical protein